MLSSASAEGIGTVLLIDASNSMKGSIDTAMEAARAFAARNPGQPLSVVFFNAKPTVALPLTTERSGDQGRAREVAEARRGHTHLRRARRRRRPGARLGARRRAIVLLSDGDDVGSVTSLDSAVAQLEAQNHPRLHGRDRVVRLRRRRPRAHRRRDRAARTRRRAPPSGLTQIYDELGFQLGNEYLLRYRSIARPDENVDVEVAVAGARARLLLVRRARSTGIAADRTSPSSSISSSSRGS